MAKVPRPTDPSVKIKPSSPVFQQDHALKLGRNLITIFRKDGGIPVEIVNIAFNNPRLSEAVVDKKREFTDDELTIVGTVWLRATKHNRDSVITYIKMLGENTSSIEIK